MKMNRRSDRRTPRVSCLVIAALAMCLLATGAGSAFAQDPPELSEGKVDAELHDPADEDIARRLVATFTAIDELRGVAVDVEAGVVQLSGEVDSIRSRELAGELAGKVSGVTAVENEIEETRSITRRLNVALDRLFERTWSLVDRLPLLLVAFAVFLLAVFLSSLVAKLEAPFELITKNEFLQDLARQAVRLFVVVGGVLVGLEIMDATALVGAVLGAAGVVGLAIGFAFRDLVENYVASVLLSVRQPFAPRDHIRIADHEGRVARLTSRATILVTFDGNHVRIPNGVVFKSTIENFSRKPERRFDFGVAVGVDEDLVAAQELGTGILIGMDGVLDEPPPFCLVEELGDSSVTLQFYGWVDQREVDFAKVRSEALRLVKQSFDQKSIEMPEPIHRIRVETMPESRKPQQDAPERGAHTSPRPTDEVVDISVDRHAEKLVDFERADADQDLLTDDAPIE